MQKEIMDWKNFRQAKGQSVQSYTQRFRRRALILGVDLSSQATLLKYIGGLHSYLRHTILIFNPTNLDEVCVQENCLEARGKNVPQETSKNDLKLNRNEKNYRYNHKYRDAAEITLHFINIIILKYAYKHNGNKIAQAMVAYL